MPYKDKEKGIAYKKAYYLANKEILSEKRRKRYWENPQKNIDDAKEWYRRNTERKKAYDIKRYSENKDKIKEINYNWVSNNKEKVRAIKKRYRDSHKEFLRNSGRDYSKSHRDQSNKHRRQWRRDNPERVKEEKLKFRFNITLNDYNKLLEQQENQCGICATLFDFKNSCGLKYPSVDHCHDSTKKVRGLLCRRCNSGLGGFNDNIDFLKKALLWLLGQIEIVKPSIQKITTSYKKSYLKKYNLTPDQFKNIILVQNNKCGICEKDLSKTKINGSGTAPYNIDHCHITGKVRGILCPKCNRALGLLKDDPEIIKNAIKWLEEKGSNHESN